MRALVIGGTRFLGRHTVLSLLEHDYDVTILNRGNMITRSQTQTPSHIFVPIETITALSEKRVTV